MVGTTRSDNEFSRPFAVDALGAEEIVRDIEAKPAEREALARRLGLLALGSLKASLRLRSRENGPLIQVSGRFSAEVTQACVVTLDPVEQSLSGDFEMTYSREPLPEAAGTGDVELTLADEDPPELVEEGAIDLGEAAVQQLAVALDPYPRRPDAEIPASLKPEEQAEETPAGPFAKLRILKGGRQG